MLAGRWCIHQTPQAGLVKMHHPCVTRAMTAQGAAHQPSSHEVYYYCGIVNHEIGDLLLHSPEVDLYHVFFHCHCY